MTVKTFTLRFSDARGLLRACERLIAEGTLELPKAPEVAAGEACGIELQHPQSGRRLLLGCQAVSSRTAIEGTFLMVRLADPSPGLENRLRRFARLGIDPSAGDNPHQRLAGLGLPEQLRLARSGERADRVAVERIQGKLAWEALLENPRITAIEVAAIARKGALPQPLLDRIVSNDAWLASPEVRRALLSNPRLRGMAVERVLRSLPAAELKLVEKQTAYPASVRWAARRLMSRGG